MALGPFTYTKSPVAIDRLTQEVQQSSIVTALDHMDLLGGNQLTIYFKGDGSIADADKVTLDTLVANHTGQPLPQNTSAPVNLTNAVSVSSQPDPAPFATPTYRTKREGVANIVACASGAATIVDYRLLEDRYLWGGAIIVENAVLGDWVNAQIYDADGVIPAPYRTSPICESWPTVATYITKEFIRPQTPTSLLMIDARPLAAKVTAGLYLRVTYNAVADTAAVTRNAAINYYAAKKL